MSVSTTSNNFFVYKDELSKYTKLKNKKDTELYIVYRDMVIDLITTICNNSMQAKVCARRRRREENAGVQREDPF